MAALVAEGPIDQQIIKPPIDQQIIQSELVLKEIFKFIPVSFLLFFLF